MNEMASQPAPASVLPGQPLSVTLAAAEWNTVLSALAELPFKVAQPLIERMVGQLQQQAGQEAAREEQPPGYAAAMRVSGAMQQGPRDPLAKP